MQSDPIGLEGGENSFVYVGYNPLVRVDERGLIPNALEATCPAGGFYNPVCDAGVALDIATSVAIGIGVVKAASGGKATEPAPLYQSRRKRCLKYTTRKRL